MAAKSHTKPIDSLLDTSLHSREKRSISTHQNTDTSSPNQETLRSHWSNPNHREQTPLLKGVTNFQHTERPPQTQQYKQDEKAEKYSAGKGT